MVGGAERLHRIAEKLPLVHGRDVDKTVAWFEKYGRRAVFFGRMLPIFRSLISIPAGIARMNLWFFGALTAAGSLVWNSVLILAGYTLGANWVIVEQYANILQYLVIAVVLLWVIRFVYQRVQARRNRRSV